MTRPFRLHAIAGLLVLIAAALWFNLPHLAPGAFNWAEPGNIAAALAEGRGFSDPFGGGTGATAWMPPAFPVLAAGVFLVAGVKSAAAATVLLVLAVLGLALAHALLLALVSDLPRGVRLTASIAFLFYVTVLPGGFLDVLSEAWLSVLMTTLFLWGVVTHRRAPSRRATCALIIGATLGPLTHAGLAAGVVAILVAMLGCDWRARRPLTAGLAALTALVIAIGGWTMRNRVVLGHWIPLKSNLWYELHVTTLLSADGLVRSDTMVPRHPFFSSDEFARYAQLGEMAYVASFRAPTLARIGAAPAEFLQRVARRAGNAFVALASDETIGLTRHRFPPHDRTLLAAAGLMLLPPPELGSEWLKLDVAPEVVRDRMRLLGLEDGAGAFRDWLEHRAAAAQRRLAWWPRFGRLLLSGLPMAALALALALGRGRLPAAVGWAALLHVCTLAPFVLINHGPRQQFPQTALHALFFAAVPAAALTARIRVTS